MIHLRQPDPAAFAPFGALIEGPALHGDRRLYSDWLAPVAGLALQFHINSVPRSDLPLTVTQVERHPHATQVFVPLDVSRYLVTVMPDVDGRPDPSGTIAMILPGTMGVIYRANAWHMGVTVLDRDGRFAVLMWRGAPDDDVFAPVLPISIHAPTAAQKTRP
jgi:ureidoglycolate lyase